MSATANGLPVQRLLVEEFEGEVRAWRELAARAMEPNVFFEPAFALALAGSTPAQLRPRFVAVWRQESLERRLVGLFPIAARRFRFGGDLMSIWLHKQTALGAPLVDRDCDAPALAAFLDWLAKGSSASGVVLPRLVRDGPLHKALLDVARSRGGQATELEIFDRAALLRGSDRDALCRRGASAKALKDLQRRRRRLAEAGAASFSISASAQEARVAAGRFLELESSGWKRSTAFLVDPALAAFFRSATEGLAREGKCRIASLTLDERPLAMGVVLESVDRAFFWKIAYDEAFRSRAPGIGLVYELTAALAARDDIALTDSCAIANHPMIDRFWPDRIGICDLAVPLPGVSAAAFASACRRELWRRRLREKAKRVLQGLLARKQS